MRRQPEPFIAHCRSMFVDAHRSEEAYLRIRTAFNASRCIEERAALFVYLNRFGFNGLCRYNRHGQFNVPWGKPAQVPYFPEMELRVFAHKAQRATFSVGSFEATMRQAKRGDVVYCGPPYADAQDTKTFTQYAGNTFPWKDHQRLADVARHLSSTGVTVPNSAGQRHL